MPLFDVGAVPQSITPPGFSLPGLYVGCMLKWLTVNLRERRPGERASFLSSLNPHQRSSREPNPTVNRTSWSCSYQHCSQLLPSLLVRTTVKQMYKIQTKNYFFSRVSCIAIYIHKIFKPFVPLHFMQQIFLFRCTQGNYHNTVKLVYKDRPMNQQNMALIHRWFLYTGSITWRVCHGDL